MFRKVREDAGSHFHLVSSKPDHGRSNYDKKTHEKIWPDPKIACQNLGRLNLPVTVSTPEEFTEKGPRKTA